MPTIHDVAKKAKVSVMTVSRVMNNPEKVSPKTIQRIHRVMERLGYQPSHIARSLVRKKTNTLGIVMPDIKNTFFNSWFRWVEEYARTFNYTLLLCNTDESIEHEMNHVRLLQAQRVDGIMIVAHAHESVLYLKRSKMPFVLVDRVYPEVEADYITTDHYSGAFDATEYLIKLGHRNIGILKGPGILFPDVERYRGFCDAMKKHRIKISPFFIRNCEFQETRSHETVIELLGSENRPTALFSFNSLMTIGAIKAIHSMNFSIPKDISLVGFDEIPGHGIFTPSVTYVLQPIEELGRNATKILLEKIEHPTSGKKHRLFLKPKLIVGDSCRRITGKQSSIEQ
jgi:LacI family transcriptional regulator